MSVIPHKYCNFYIYTYFFSIHKYLSNNRGCSFNSSSLFPWSVSSDILTVFNWATNIKESAKDLSESLHEMTMEEKVSRIFINVGIPPHIKGYSFLREGIDSELLIIEIT